MIREWRILFPLLVLILLLLAFIFKSKESSNFLKKSQEINRAIAEVKETKELEKIWNPVHIKRKLEFIRSVIPSNSIKYYNIKRRKVEISVDKLSGRDLNNLISKLSSTPVKFTTMDIKRDGDEYSMECICQW